VGMKGQAGRLSAWLGLNPARGHASEILGPRDTSACSACSEDGEEFPAGHNGMRA